MNATITTRQIIKVRTILGVSSILTGCFGVVLAVFDTTPQDNIHYVLGNARLICGLSGIFCMLLGLGLIRDRYRFTRMNQKSSWKDVRVGGRKSLEVFVLCMLFCILLLPFRVTSLKTYTPTVTVTPTTLYNGIANIQVTGSIPNQMGTNRRGFFGAIFWNPTDKIYQITRVEFNASNAINEVFNGLEQGIGRSYPTSGWVYDDISKKGVYLAKSILVQPHTSQEFYVRIKPNKKLKVFSVQLRITANGTVYEQSYVTRQQPDASPVSVLWIGQGPEPQFVISEPLSTERTFYVTLHEDSNKINIDSGGTLTIDIPTDFTNIEDINGAGWGTAIITGNRIEVPNTVAFKESYITYAFNASTPATQGLYMLNVTFNGTPDEHPIGNFSIRITDSSTP